MKILFHLKMWLVLQFSIHKVKDQQSRSKLFHQQFPISGDLFTKNKEDVKAREAELSAQGQYFSASYAAERGSKSKEESGEKGGAAVIPICLPLCCAAPCVIM